MQAEGNLVVYVAGGRPVWASGTNGAPGSHLMVQNDGNVVVYRPDSTAVWATNTWVPTGPRAQGDQMLPGQVLNPGQSINSADGRFTFIYQNDGNLVLYRSGVPLWASSTNGPEDGVFVMQAGANRAPYLSKGNPVVASDTSGSPRSHLIGQNVGKGGVYGADNMAIWATNPWVTVGRAAKADQMQPGQVLNPGQGITSADGRFNFVYQNDGNLVLYRSGAPLWASSTNGRGVGVCIMQTDGNLVLYTPGGHALWASGTSGSPGSHLIAQNDGNV